MLYNLLVNLCMLDSYYYIANNFHLLYLVSYNIQCRYHLRKFCNFVGMEYIYLLLINIHLRMKLGNFVILCMLHLLRNYLGNLLNLLYLLLIIVILMIQLMIEIFLAFFYFFYFIYML